MKKKDLSALLTLLAVVFFGCGAALLFSKSRREPISRSAFLLNTFVNITLYDSQDEAILDHCVDMCQEYENQIGRAAWRERVEISVVAVSLKKKKNRQP